MLDHSIPQERLQHIIIRWNDTGATRIMAVDGHVTL